MKMLWLCCIEAAPSSIILFDTAFKNSLVMGFVSSAVVVVRTIVETLS